MSHAAMVWVEEHSPYGGATYQVHHYLAYKANSVHGWRIWLWQRTIAAKLRLHRATVNKSMGQLVSDGYLEVLKAPQGRPNLYRLVGPFSAPPATPPVALARALQEEHPETCVENTHPEPDWGRSRRSGNRGPDPPERLLRIWAELEGRQPSRAWLARHHRIAAAFLAQFPGAAGHAEAFLRWARAEGTWHPAGWCHVYPRWRPSGGAPVGGRPPAETLAALVARRAELLAEAEREPSGPLDLSAVPRQLREVTRRGALRRGVSLVDETTGMGRAGSGEGLLPCPVSERPIPERRAQ